MDDDDAIRDHEGLHEVERRVVDFEDERRGCCACIDHVGHGPDRAIDVREIRDVFRAALERESRAVASRERLLQVVDGALPRRVNRQQKMLAEHLTQKAIFDGERRGGNLRRPSAMSSDGQDTERDEHRHGTRQTAPPRSKIRVPQTSRPHGASLARLAQNGDGPFHATGASSARRSPTHG